MGVVDLVAALAKVLVVIGAIQMAVGGMSWVERRGSAIIQLRRGPNRVGPFGVLQPLADGIKFLWKEDIVPPFTHRPTFILAPVVAFFASTMTFAILPFGGTASWEGHDIPLVIADIDAGVLFMLAVSSLGVYGIIMAGWASNSKYSQLGGLRSASQMISYELALGLAVIAAVVMCGSLRPYDIVIAQAEAPARLLGLVTVPYLPNWYVFANPLGFLLLLVAIFAEANRLPFDLPEAETELVAGYHTEYSSMKFLMFMMAEYTAMIAGAALLVTLYLGGYSVPQVVQRALSLEGNWLAAAEMAVFAAKIGFFMWLFVWVRWTLPRFRFDQLLRLGWKALVPMGLFVVIWAGLLAARGWV
ncbi:MAG: NADH-quinone oxidoreductase subunit NuoH [Acidobacteriota bacterium]|nr:NADH-quinone oxidoreductase subunit NuoH [Acidobacteriota bacterium]